jgi:hypothetical protein
MLRQPVPCGEYFIYLPGVVALEAMRYARRYGVIVKTCGSVVGARARYMGQIPK